MIFDVLFEATTGNLKLEHQWHRLTGVPDGYDVQRDMISKRFDLSYRHTVMSLNASQKQTLKEFVPRLLNGDYRMMWHACVCGSCKFTTISEYDRYGIPVNTVLCRRCGQLQSNPYLDHQSTASFYRRYYRSIYSGSHQPESKHFQEQLRQGARINKFFRSKGFIPGRKIFEIGCGAGGILHTFNSSRHECYGCDYNDTYLEFGRAHGLSLSAGEASVLQPHGKADLIILSHVIEHFLDPVKEFENISCLLADDGFLFIEVPNAEKLNSYYRADILRFLQNAHNWHFTQKSLDRLMASCGYHRIFGNHRIRAVYQKRPTQSIPSIEGEARRQLSMCRRHERRRPVFSLIIRMINSLAAIYRSVCSAFAGK